MELTIDQAAAALGKSPWQVRYLIKTQRMPAKKRGGRWFIREEDLVLTPAQSQEVARKEREYRAAVDRGVGLDAEPRTDRYSVRQLKGFQIGLPLYRKALELWGDANPATRELRAMLVHLACGCHRFDRADKSTACPPPAPCRT